MTFMVLDALAEALEGLAAADPATLSDPEALVDLHRQLARLEAVVTRATAIFDADAGYAFDGAQGTAAWLAWRCRLSPPCARRRVRLGRALQVLPACATAWTAGEITGEHVSTIAAVRSERTAAALARDEELLVGHARTLGFRPFSRAVAYWEQLADPAGSDQRDHDRRDRRDVWLAESIGGLWLGKITLDPISGTIVADELSRREAELFAADWADAKQRLGRDPVLAELARTPGQRRADALVEMATRSASAPPGGRRPAPLFTVLVGYETLHGRICELAQGTPVAPASLLPWLEAADIERAVFGPGVRVEVSERTRLFSGATRRALEIRDRFCTHPSCERPAAASQADHVVPYGMGGPTIQDNGQMLCGFHNRLKEQRPPPEPEPDP